MDLPKVLILGNNFDKIYEMIEKMTAKECSKQDDIDYYTLEIDNKYYTAEISLCLLKDLSKRQSIQDIEGLIIYEDLLKANNNNSLEKWMPTIDSLSEVEVRLLICESLAENSDKDKVLEWCTQKRFELVELECSDQSELEDLELEHNTFGISRIIEAIHAHRWPNMSMKGQSSHSGLSKNDVNKVTEQIENINLESNDVSKRLQMDSILDGLMENEDTDFGELFGELRAMKEHVISLPGNERKEAAELLVMAFWKAMGGNEIDEFS